MLDWGRQAVESCLEPLVHHKVSHCCPLWQLEGLYAGAREAQQRLCCSLTLGACMLYCCAAPKL